MHAPSDYSCPFCRVASGGDLDPPYTSQAEVVLREPEVLAFVSSRQWPMNKGHVIVIPRSHHENLYELPVALGTPLLSATQRVAQALRLAYGCPGISTRQHNEPAGNQDVWHYHVHVFPRYVDDALYLSQGERVDPSERLRQASLLREHLRGAPAA